MDINQLKHDIKVLEDFAHDEVNTDDAARLLTQKELADIEAAKRIDAQIASDVRDALSFIQTINNDPLYPGHASTRKHLKDRLDRIVAKIREKAKIESRIAAEIKAVYDRNVHARSETARISSTLQDLASVLR